ncbi:MAG: HK97 family phage prohead protease [Candidatus Peribacteria bacterium]|nr:HK97 family phage prohead protease [Candidatus Peribacteria bacterium]
MGKTTKLYKEGEQRVAEGVFAGTETAQTVRQLYDEGIINTASVGFITLQRNEQDRDIIEKWELLEWSFVSIPANPEAHRKNAALVKKAIEMGIITKMQKVEEKSETIDEVLDNEDSSEESNEKKIENIETELKEIKKILKTLADGNAKAKDFEAKEVLQQVDRIVGEALRSFKSK